MHSRFYTPCLLLLLAIIGLGHPPVHAQTPHALVSGIQIDSLLRTHGSPNRMALDPVSGHIFYGLPGGDVYEVSLPNGLPATDSLRYTAADHGITDPEGMCFVDSTLFISGSTNTSPGYVLSRISKATLQANGTRVWATVVEAPSHPASIHPFTSVITDPTHQFLYWASGARTMAGERSGSNNPLPGYREGPFNSRLYKIPIQTTGLILPSDSATLDSSGYVYCWGLRNAYAMAWDAAGELFAIDNSGERDDAEELNWLRQGRHYGFPWRMGDHWNPLRDPNYDVELDPLVNHLCGGYHDSIFKADPTFPLPPNTIFVDPIKNLGPDADFFRDSITGQVRDASAEGLPMRSFTPHRSPLGLTLDRDSLLGGNFQGRAFALSFMPGGDSSGMSPVSPWGTPGPFVDPAQDLLQLDLSYDAGDGDYIMQTHRIIDGFYLPVDALLDGNQMYVIEQRGGGRPNLWRVTFPVATAQDAVTTSGQLDLRISPNPVSEEATLHLNTTRPDVVSVQVCDLQGRVLRKIDAWRVNAGENAVKLELQDLAAGVYIVSVAGIRGNGWARLLKQ